MKNRFRQIYLEITNICNLSCPFCSKDSRKKEYMEFDDFKKYALMCKPHTDSLYLHLKGEPLMHPNFIKMLDYLEETGINVKLTTNGDYLTKYQDELLNHNNILRINISLQSLITKELTDVKSYLDSLKVFLELISKSGKTSVSLRLWNDKDNIKVTEYNNYIKQYFKDCFNQDFVNSKPLIPHVYASIENEFTWPSENTTNNQIVSKCLGGTTHIGILVNGEVVLCCLDSEGATSIGSLKEKELSEIIDSDNFKKIVSDLKNGKPYFDVCKRCTYRSKFQ